MDSTESQIYSENEIRSEMERLGLPQYMHGALVRYVVHRIKPGNFMTALLSNDLLGVIDLSDDTNFALIKQWVEVLYHCEEIPSGCWGSREHVDAWLSGEGANG